VSESKVVTWIQEVLAQDFFDADIQRDVAMRRAFLDGRAGTSSELESGAAGDPKNLAKSELCRPREPGSTHQARNSTA